MQTIYWCYFKLLFLYLPVSCFCFLALLLVSFLQPIRSYIFRVWRQSRVCAPSSVSFTYLPIYQAEQAFIRVGPNVATKIPKVFQIPVRFPCSKSVMEVLYKYSREIEGVCSNFLYRARCPRGSPIAPAEMPVMTRPSPSQTIAET